MKRIHIYLPIILAAYTLQAILCSADELVKKLRGTPDAAATQGEAKTLDRDGIYCWWKVGGLKPGYFEVIARARAKKRPGVLHFVLCDNRPDGETHYAVSKTKRALIETGQYREYYCGAFYWDGSFPPRVSDWSSAGLMVDWVKLAPIAASDVRDPDPSLVKRYLAPRFEKSPTIDADLSEWTRVPRLILGAEHARPNDYRGTADLSAVCRWAWDDKALYFAAEVQDDEFQFLKDASQLSGLWRYDAIQMAFDAAHNAKGPGYENDDYEYGFGLADGAGRAYRWRPKSGDFGYGNNLPLNDVPNVTVAVRPDERKHLIVYEVAIPWNELLPFSPRQPHCGMTLTINDNDGGKPMRAWLEWTPGIAGAKDPSAFGVLRLIDSPPSATDVAAWLIGERDLSNRETASFRLHVSAPETLGAVEVGWRVQKNGKQLASAKIEAKLPTPSSQIEIEFPLRELRNGFFELHASLSKNGIDLATASERFACYDVRGLTDLLSRLEARQKELWKRLVEHQKAGRPLCLPQATLATVAELIKFTRDDLKKKRYERTQEVLAELRKMLDEAEAEIAELLAHPKYDLSAAKLARERLTVRDGAFWSGDRPVFLVGFCGWWQVWTGTRRLARLGINHFEDSIIAPFALFPKDEMKPDKALMDGLDWGFLYGDQSGAAYSRMLACNQLPKGFHERHPKACANGGWGGLCTLHPELRKFEAQYLTTVARVAKRHWATAVYVLWGESGHSISEHEMERAAFADHLRKKYETIAELNAAWRTNFNGFDDPRVYQKVDSPVAWRDRGVFNQRTFTQWTSWLAEQIRKEDPKALVSAYPSLLSWDDSSDFSNGIDVEALCNVLDVNSCDTAALDYGGRRWAMSSITGFTMVQDLLRAFNAEHPNYDPELHLVNPHKKYPPQYIRAALFQAFFHGLSAANLWVFQRNEGIDSMLTFQPRVMQSYARAALDLRRLVEPIRAFQRAPGEVGILYSLTSVAYNPRHLEELRSVYEGFYFLDAKCVFVTDRTVVRGGLDGLKLLVLPQASHVPKPVAQTILTWVRDGGALLAVGDCLTRDASNREMTDVLPRGEKRSIVGVPGRSSSMGDGKIIRIEPFRELATYEVLGDELFNTAEIDRPFRVTDPTGKRVDGVEMRVAKTSEGRRLCYLINMNKQDVSVKLAPDPGDVTDLVSGKSVAFPCRVRSLEVLLLAWDARGL